jgi:hypothetical protein
MKQDISRFIAKDSTPRKIRFNQTEIYKFLKEYGYGRDDTFKVFYQRTDEGVISSNFRLIRMWFTRMLLDKEFTNIHNLDYYEISEAYLKTMPIKDGDLFKYYLNQSLSADEIHNLKSLLGR